MSPFMPRGRQTGLRNAIFRILAVDESIRPNDKLLSRGGFRDHISRYHFAARHLGGAQVLDIACGSGYGTAYLRYKGARRVVGGDISGQALDAARRYYHGTGTEFVLLSGTRLPFQDNTFEAVVSMETIEHLSDFVTFLKEILRVLQPQGSLILSTPNKEVASPGSDTPLWPYHIHEFRPRELERLLTSFFHKVTLWGQRPVRPGNRRVERWLGDSMVASKFVLQRLPGGPSLVRLVGSTFVQDLYPVNITNVERLEAEVGTLDLFYPLEPEKPSSTVSSVLLAMAQGPRK